MNVWWCILVSTVLCLNGCQGDKDRPALPSITQSEEGDSDNPIAPTASSEEEVPPGMPSATQISFRDGKLAVSGASVSFPADVEALATLFGRPDRTIQARYVIHVWDSFGVFGYQELGSKEITELVIAFQADVFPNPPTSSFHGSVVLESGTIQSDSLPADLIAAGLKCEEQLLDMYILKDPPYTVIADIDESMMYVSISCSL